MHILETGLYTNKLEESEHFYVNILGLELVKKKEGRHLFLKLNKRMIVLFNPDATKVEGSMAPTHGSYGEGHMAFGVTPNELEEWRIKLPNNGVRIEKEVAWENGAKSIYFRDPGNNSLEFITEDFWEKQ